MKSGLLFRGRKVTETRTRSWLPIWKIKNRLKGFTIVELLVVVTIFSFVALGIGSAFMSGMKIWARAQDVGFFQNNILLTLEMISKQLRQSADIAYIGFKGTKEELAFPSLIGDSIVKITYKFKPEEKSLWRSTTNLKDILTEGKKYSENKVLSALEGVSLSYFYFDPQKLQYKWKEDWKQEEGMPWAIKFEIKAKGQTFTKTVFIPIT